MGVFVDYPSNPFSNLKDVGTTILSANTHPVLVSSIIVCNRTADKILVNLKKIRTQNTFPTPTILKEVFTRNNCPIEPYDTVDILANRGLKINLEYDTISIPSISDSLVIFSNGYTQIFDCDISYMTLNDLPVPVPPPPTE